MKIVVENGRLSDAELDVYLRRIAKRYPPGLIEKVIFTLQGEYVDVQCVLHRFREVRKMSGYCIGSPEDWNEAKQAELRDTVPNPID